MTVAISGSSYTNMIESFLLILLNHCLQHHNHKLGLVNNVKGEYLSIYISIQRTLKHSLDD